MGLTTPLSIWAVSDGRAGIEAQVDGLAQAVARLRPAQVTVKRIGWKAGVGRLPWRLNIAPQQLLAADSPIAAPWPDIWIAAGRATLPLSTRVRRWSEGQTFVVQTQDPRTDPAAFDLVIPPTHDRLEGPNVFPILGAPNRLTPDRLAADLARFAALIDPLPHPRLAVIVGGDSKAFRLTDARAVELADQISTAVRAAAGAVLMSFTRRTPASARRILTERLDGLPGLIWDDRGENPYFAFLAAADAILVTEDSVNLATDAASTGKPLYIATLAGGSAKMTRFHRDLADLGVHRPFIGDLDSWTYSPLGETERAAAELLRRYVQRTTR